MMPEQQKPLNIYQKLVEIRKAIDKFVKDAHGHKFDYVSGAQVLGKIKAKMDEMGVILEPHLVEYHHDVHEYLNQYNKPKKDFIVWGSMMMTWVNAEDPKDRAEVKWQMAGQQDDLSQALGSGLTYAERYFLLKSFNVPTDQDDPDAKQGLKNGPQEPRQGGSGGNTSSGGKNSNQSQNGQPGGQKNGSDQGPNGGQPPQGQQQGGKAAPGAGRKWADWKNLMDLLGWDNKRLMENINHMRKKNGAPEVDLWKSLDDEWKDRIFKAMQKKLEEMSKSDEGR
jgi:hypothetical protein